ncbi:energy-coupling factor transporter transmembrane protein EcfT [Weissella coleopterorum]|uniref:Energy-coupling factor transporter transmembrane protein EcfT n=1 Tax=Weissella coleopterorum TaxID=2714949 RepID=A0A6G8B1W8_9LACO|nr:energy-coupling factor transporter transmembrane component T [Weissella coleopterorum]QIL51215.1 energy-coupling factor transporter transmembrane protein EcfT [Weissella coleopterorum]
MFSKILIGRYLPGNSLIHRLDPRVKLVLSIAFIFMIFLATNWPGYLLATAMTLLVVNLTRLGLGVFIRGVRPLIFLMLFTTLLQVLFVTTGHVWWAWGWLKITTDGLVNGGAIFIRFMLIIMFSTVLTLTTPPLDIADALETLLRPLQKVKVPVAELALMVSIALRFVPTLLDEAEMIINAQRARGVLFNEGNLIKRAKAFIPVLIPLFINAIKRAIELGDAMEVRGYRGDVERSKYRLQTWQRIDTWAVLVFIIFAILLFNFYFVF